MVKKKISSSIGQAVLVGLLLVIGLIPAHSVTYGQGIPTKTPSPSPYPTGQTLNSNWSVPYVFERTGWFPAITTDRSGRIYVAWANSVVTNSQGPVIIRQGYDVVLFTSSANGTSWDPINEVAALAAHAADVAVTRPALVVDPQGILHMTWRAATFSYYTDVPAVASSSALAWSKSQQLASDMAYFSNIAIDSKGRIHVIWNQNTPTSDCLECYHIMYRSTDDGGKTWTPDADLSKIPTGAAKMQILVDDQDNVHIVWEAGRGGSLGFVSDPTTVYYMASYNRGVKWTQPVQLGVSGAERTKFITIGEDGHGNLVSAYLSLPDNTVYYQVSMDHGLSWSIPALIPEIWGNWNVLHGQLDDFNMATDSAGNIHMVMVGSLNPKDDKTLKVLHLVWNGTAWSRPETIDSYVGDVPEWPRIAVSNGNQLNVVWFVRGKDYVWIAAGDYYKIHYSYSKTDAPYIAPTPWPPYKTPTPAPPTPEPTATLATVMPTVPPINATLDTKSLDESTYNERGQLNVVGLSLVPAFFIVGVLLIVLVIRRR